MAYPTQANCCYFYISGHSYSLSPVTSGGSGVPGLTLVGTTLSGVVTGGPQIIDSTINGLPWRAIVCTGGFPSITSPLFYAGQVGVPFSEALTATTTGEAPVRWHKHSEIVPAICSSRPEDLPPGLSLAEDGQISGTPTVAGIYTCWIIAFDTGNNPNNGISDLTIIVSPSSAPTITCGDPPDGTVGIPYSHELPNTHTGTFSVEVTDGALPDGLTMSTAGLISGTPTLEGDFPFTATITDDIDSSTVECSIHVNPIPAPTINCGDPPDGTVGISYSHTLPNTHTGTFSVEVTAGALPDGLTMDTSGLITGTPTVAGEFPFTAAITADDEQTAEVECSITIAPIPPPPAPTINCGDPPDGTVDVAYSHTLPNTHTGTFSVEVTAGALPDGLTMDTSGLITGTPTVAGEFPFTAAITADDEQTAEVECSITIAPIPPPPAPTINCGDPPDGTVDVAYSHALPNTHTGTLFEGIEVTDGALPDGLTMDASGLITGTPTIAGYFPFTATITADGQTGEVGCAIYINSIPAPTIGCGDPPSGRIGFSYSHAMPVTHHSGTFTVVVTGGALPDGLTMSSTGLITGTPTVAGEFPFTAAITADDQTDEVECSIRIYGLTDGWLWLDLWVWRQLFSFTGVDQIIELPPGYERALKLELAARFGRAVPGARSGTDPAAALRGDRIDRQGERD